MATQVSTALVMSEDKLLMVFDENEDVWNVPSISRKKGELSVDTAERALKTHTGCESESVRYRKRLKTTLSQGSQEVTVQSFEMEITQEPEEGEWVHVSEIGKRDLAESLDNLKEEIKDRL